MDYQAFINTVNKIACVVSVKINPDGTPGDLCIEAANDLYLKSLNIDNCTELSHLDCQENEIETLDISKCTKLRYINCESNELEALDVSKAYDLNTLVCGKNSILDVDVSKNKDLLYLDCHLNPLKLLDREVDR